MQLDPGDMMPADLDALWRPDPDVRGAVLITLGIELERLPLCGFCPLARWYERDGLLGAFCKEFRETVYPPAKGAGVTLCDAFAIVSGRIKEPGLEG